MGKPMKNKKFYIFILIIMLLGLGFFYKSYLNYPKKIVAESIYTLDDSLIREISKFFPGLDIEKTFRDYEEKGTFTLSFLKVGRDDFKNFILIEDPLNKKKLSYYRIENPEEAREYGEIIINNNIYLTFPKILDKSLYIDRNTASVMAKNTSIAKDLNFDFTNDFFLSPPMTPLDKKTRLKKYLREEWTAFLNSTRVKKLGEGKYQIIINTKDSTNLLKNFEDFLKNEGGLPKRYYSFADDFLNIFNQDLTDENIKVFYMDIDKNKDIKKIYTSDEKYVISLENPLIIKFPNLSLKARLRTYDHRNTINALLNGRSFSLSYYPKDHKIFSYYKGWYFDGDFYDFKAGNYFKISGLLNHKGENNKIALNFYKNPKEIKEKDKNFELLKFSQDDWDKVKDKFIPYFEE